MHPVIYLISPPRARSTILFRALQAQLPTLTCFHEPSQAVHDKETGITYAADWWQKDAFTSYSEIQNAILSASEKGPVLVKEMSFACHNCLTPEYLQHNNLYFMLMVRNPLQTIASFYKQVENENNLIPEIFVEDIGFRGLLELHQRVKTYCPNPPSIINNEEFKDPESLFRKIFAKVNISIEPKLNWDSLAPDFDPTEWHEQKKPELTQYWHGPAISSTQIHYLESPIQTFDDLKMRIQPKHQDLIEEAYKVNRDYYERIYN
jgi:hypothetical protein